MQELDLFLVFARRLNRLNVAYMVTGSVASMAYGEPRLTHDVDLVLEVARTQVQPFCEVFSLAEFYCPPAATIVVESQRSSGGHFNLIHHETGFKADCYLMGKDPLHVWAMARRRRIEVEDEPVFLAPPEYVIVRKLEYYREGGTEKHLRDIRSMLDVSGELIDRAELAAKIRDGGLEAEWALVQKG